MKCLNLGCGKRFHSDWINVDSVPCDVSVIKHDLQKGIPFEDSSFNVVYHSHILEHFTKDVGSRFMQECYRVLQPKGIIRVVVPDLEQIIHTYLLALEKALEGDQVWQANYDWMLLELIDQMARNYSGGMMKVYLQRETIPNIEFVKSRIGSEFGNALPEFQPTRSISALQKRMSVIKQFLKPVYKFFRSSEYRRDALLKVVLGKEFSALEIGRFRQSGEVHYWMYDRYSLKKLLSECGFTNIEQCQADESYIPDWKKFNLDTEPDGSVCKPDSIFIEAIKPSS